MSRKQKKRSTIAFAPLVFLDRTSLPEAGVSAAAVVDELPPDLAVPVWDVLRAIHLHGTAKPLSSLYGANALRAWEEELLLADLDPALRQPLAVIIGQFSRDAADLPLLSRACLVVAEWALGHGARWTALAFQEASALCWPDSGRCALAVGRAYRTRGLLRDAERWLRRARNLTLWDRDWEAHALAVNTLGMVCWHEGASEKALRHLHRALRITRRHKFRKLEGEILHNLLVVAITSDEGKNVEQYAAAALERYLPDHPRIPALAYDLAYYWLMRGRAASSLSVFTSLLPHFSDPHQQIQVLAATARAAGLRQERDLFDRAWAQAFALIARHRAHVSIPSALLDLAMGAAHLERFADARTACRMALHEAGEQGQSDVVIRADAYMTAVEKNQNPDALAGSRSTRVVPAKNRLAERLLDVLCGETDSAPR